MENLRLLSLLEEVLGKAKKTSSGNYAFYCPNCNHHKRKLEINLERFHYHCWICDQDMKGRNLIGLFKKLKVGKKRLEKLFSIVGQTPQTLQSKEYAEQVKLPDEFIPMWKPNSSPEYRNAMHYMKSRGISEQDIAKYRIGYCDKGAYSNKIIVPSYDANGHLNFFTGRSYYDSDKFKHKNPSTSKDIIGFELFVNWDLPIVIVEGVFDAMAVKRNCIPLFGKIVLDSLKKKIVEQNVKEIYIALDQDAFKKALDIVEYFMNQGITVYLVELGDTDPADMGFENITRKMKSTPPITFAKIMEYKLFSI